MGREVGKAVLKDRPSLLGEWEFISNDGEQKDLDSNPALQKDGCVTLRKLFLSFQK